MSDFDIYVSASVFGASFVVIASLSLVLIASRFLPALAFGRRDHGPLHNGSRSLSLNLRQSLSHGLLGGNSRRYGRRNRRDLHGNLTLKGNLNLLFTILLRQRNEECFNHFMFKFILDKDVENFDFSGSSAPRSIKE